MGVRFWGWATIVLGVATLALFGAFSMLPEMRAAGECLAAGSVVKFELASSVDDLQAIFGPSGSECRELGVAAMDAVNRLDIWAFIPTYTLFCVAGALFLARGAPRLLAFVAVAAAFGAAVSDYVETLALLEITETLDAPGALLAQSQAGAWSKFALLATHAFFCAGVCFNDAQRRPILGLLLLLPALGTAAAWLDHERLTNVMNGGFAIAWAALLVVAVRDTLFARAPSAAPAKDASP